MGRKLNRVLDEIEKTKKKIAEWQGYLQELHMQRKQLEDAEILKAVRSTRLEGRELLEFLSHMQEGTAAGNPEETETAQKKPEETGKRRRRKGRRKARVNGEKENKKTACAGSGGSGNFVRVGCSSGCLHG